MKFLKEKWPYILALAVCTFFMSSFLIGFELVLSNPSLYPFLEEPCDIANCSMQYKDVVVILLMSIISCTIINLFASLFGYFLKKVTEVKKDENDKRVVK